MELQIFNNKSQPNFLIPIYFDILFQTLCFPVLYVSILIFIIFLKWILVFSLELDINFYHTQFNSILISIMEIVSQFLRINWNIISFSSDLKSLIFNQVFRNSTFKFKTKWGWKRKTNSFFKKIILKFLWIGRLFVVELHITEIRLDETLFAIRFLYEYQLGRKPCRRT